MAFRSFWLPWIVGVSLLSGCSCSPLREEVDSFAFTRCAERSPPKPRRVKAQDLELEIAERVVSIRAQGDLRIAAFTGPIGAVFTRADLAVLAATKARVLLYLGGLGDTPDMASQNLSALAALRIPTVFVPGGADRLEVVDAAFSQLDDANAEWMVHASGIRELKLKKDSFFVLPGAAFGRYALDERSCGFTQADLDALAEAAEGAGKGRAFLLAWNAPAGWGLSTGAGGHDVGSEELAKLAKTIGVRGGLFAYPEAQAFELGSATQGGLSLVVPRLGRTGSQRANGGRVPGTVATLILTGEGLSPAP